MRESDEGRTEQTARRKAHKARCDDGKEENRRGSQNAGAQTARRKALRER